MSPYDWTYCTNFWMSEVVVEVSECMTIVCVCIGKAWLSEEGAKHDNQHPLVVYKNIHWVVEAHRYFFALACMFSCKLIFYDVA